MRVATDAGVLTSEDGEQSVCEIHHSDQGVQYLSKAYLAVLKAHDIQISIARRGRPWENGYAERLIRTLKEEEVHLNDYHNIHEARDRIGHWHTITDTAGTHPLIDRMAMAGKRVYGVGDEGVYRLNDRDDWEQITPAVPDSVKSFVINGDRLYIVTEHRGMFHIPLEKE